MFHLLTKYLLQYKRVAIPHVGSLEIISRPAELDFAHRLLQAPAYSVQFIKNYDADDHQLQYMAQASGEDITTIPARLNSFGAALKELLQQQEVAWKGIGRLTFANNEIVFSPEVAESEAWKAVSAHKVIRENETHAVLIGDKEMHSQEARELLQSDETITEPRTAKKTAIWIGWIAAAMAVLFVGYYLYSRHFAPYASGNTSKIVPALQQPTYR